MSLDATFKYPNCYKNVLNGLQDFSSWINIVNRFGYNNFLFGILDQCTMGDDNPIITAWQYSPLTQDSGDELFFGNNIFGPTTVPSANNYFYNTPASQIAKYLGSAAPLFPTNCLFSF
jgi:cellobiose phosphorylase